MLYRKTLFPEIATLTILVAFFHILFLQFLLYWTTDWADIVTHFLGGALIALIVIFIFFSSGYTKTSGFKKELGTSSFFIWLFTLCLVLIIGIIWELWEAWTGLIDFPADRLDSLADLVMDLIGGIFATLYAYYRVWKQD